jgi:hypothetical protein
MKKYNACLIIIFIISLHNSSFCQFNKTRPSINFIGDSLDSHRQSERDRVVDSVFHLNKNYDFQFRLWQEGMNNFSINVFVLTLKNGSWNARAFQFIGIGKGKYSWKSNPYYTEINVKQDSLDMLWERLVSNDILTLPTEESIRKPEQFFSMDTSLLYKSGKVYEGYSIVWIDGVQYDFEIFGKDKSRFYTFSSPINRLRRYPQIEELYKAASIILLIKNYLGQSFKSALKDGGYFQQESKPALR